MGAAFGAPLRGRFDLRSSSAVIGFTALLWTV
jgi:hypothetical protein